MFGNAAQAAEAIEATQATQTTEIKVIVSGALKGAFDKLIPQFERETHHKVILAWGPSSGVSADAIPVRLQNHEPVDVLIMVGASLDRYAHDSRFNAASRVDLAQSGIGVGVRAGANHPDITTPEALRQTLLQAKSIGYSEGASGTYISNTLFKQLGIADQIASKIKLVHGKELVGDVIARGDVELGLQQISELRVVRGVDYLGPLPDSLQKISVMSAVQAADLPANSVSELKADNSVKKEADQTKSSAAHQLLVFLTSPTAVAMYQQSGLDPVLPRP